MSTFVDTTVFEVESCTACGGSRFAMTADFMSARRGDHKTFYCPAGHSLHYTGPTEASKLKAELERKVQMLAAAEARAATAESERGMVAKAHRKMRDRVVNGVCPCCNRSFENLRRHMASEHADFGNPRTLYALRHAFGMTQAAVAKEAGVDTNYVSTYEREKHTPAYAARALDTWVETHQGTLP